MILLSMNEHGKTRLRHVKNRHNLIKMTRGNIQGLIEGLIDWSIRSRESVKANLLLLGLLSQVGLLLGLRQTTSWGWNVLQMSVAWSNLSDDLGGDIGSLTVNEKQYEMVSSWIDWMLDWQIEWLIDRVIQCMFECNMLANHWQICSNIIIINQMNTTKTDWS